MATVTDPGELSSERCTVTDLVVVDAQMIEAEDSVSLPDTLAGTEVILVSPTQLDSCLELMSRLGCNHIVGGNPMSSSTELVTTIRKAQSPDIFGLSKYVPWGGFCYEGRVASLIDKRNVTSWIAATAHRVGCARWLTVELEMVTDELLTNAIYPDLPDDQRFEAGPVSSADLRWACTEGCIHVAVTDKRGTFKRETLIDALRELESAPADELSLLGLPRHITLAQRIVVNVAPGRYTEMIISVPLRGRKTAVPSINFFSTEESPDEQPATTEPVTINLNGRLAFDTLGMETEVSINEINSLSAEVIIDEELERPVYPGIAVSLTVNVPFHGELKASGLVYRVQGEGPLLVSLSFATGYQDWERVVRSVMGGKG